MPAKISAEEFIKSLSQRFEQLNSNMIVATNRISEMAASSGNFLRGFEELTRFAKHFSPAFVALDALRNRSTQAAKGIDEAGKKAAEAMKKFDDLFPRSLSERFRQFGLASLETSKLIRDKVAPAFGRLADLGGALVGASGIALNSAPDLSSTVSKSIQLLLGELATILIPSFVRLVVIIQDVAGWLKSLSPGVQSAIRGFVEFGFVLVAVRSAFGVLTFVLSPLISAVGLLATGIAALAPWAASAAVALARLAPAALSAVASSISLAGAFVAATIAVSGFITALEQKARRFDDYNQGSPSVTDDEAKNSELGRKADQIQDPKKRLEFLEQSHAELALKERAALRQREKEGNSGSWTDSTTDLPQLKELERKRMNAFALMMLERQRQGVVNSNTPAGSVPDGVTPQGSGPSAGKSGGQAPGKMRFLPDMVTQSQPRFSQLNDVYRQIQLSALGPSPLEQALKQQHLEQMQLMLQQLNTLKSIDGKAGGGGLE